MLRTRSFARGLHSPLQRTRLPPSVAIEWKLLVCLAKWSDALIGILFVACASSGQPGFGHGVIFCRVWDTVSVAAVWATLYTSRGMFVLRAAWFCCTQHNK